MFALESIMEEERQEEEPQEEEPQEDDTYRFPLVVQLLRLALGPKDLLACEPLPW